MDDSMRQLRAAVAAPAAADDELPVEFRIWRSERISGLEVIHTNSHAHSYPAHLHDTLEIIWMRAGEGKLYCQHEAFEIHAGEAGVVRPNELHSGGGCGLKIEYVAIHLPRAVLEP